MSNSSEQSCSTNSRAYRMRKRLDDVDATRRRIVEAAVELHGSVGPAETTISAIAARAGVQRSTIYRHFPDEAALFAACTRHWLSQHPWPDPEQWTLLADPANRLAHALDELYRFYAAGSEMIANSYRDTAAMPEFVGVGMATQVKAMHSVLVSGWKARGRQRRFLEAAMAHAIDFRSWQSLSHTGLAPAEAAKLMTRMVLAVASGEVRR